MSRKSKNQPFAKRSLGQNFLSDPTVVRRIIDAFHASNNDVVLEIGPGRGALTESLVDSVGRLFVLEFDDAFAAQLQHRFGDRANFMLLHGDALQVDFAAISPGHQLRLISNLPYNISTAILQRLFDHADAFTDCVLMFQREVAERITAVPGSKDRGYLTVLTEAYFEVTRLFDVSPDAFQPRPKVWSTVVRLEPTGRTVPASSRFSQLVSAGFAQKRKTIANNLKSFSDSYAAALESSSIDPSRRAETLSLDEWLRLHDAISIQ